jgi:hypothetical protein
MAGVFPLEVVLVAVMVLEELATALLAGDTSEEELAGLFLLEEDSAAGVSLEEDVTTSVKKTFWQLSSK